MGTSVLSLGTYNFPLAATWFTINRRAIIGRTGRRNAVHHQWVVNGRLDGNGDADLTAKIAALEAACVDDVDVVFGLGGHELLTAATIEGTHIRSFRWLPGYDGVRGSGAECVLRRTFQFIVDGLVLAEADIDIIDWRESIIGIGNGQSDVVPAGSLGGAVQPQTVQAFTPFYATQSGYAIGMTADPDPATPLWAHGVGGVYQIGKRFSGGPTSPDYGLHANTKYKRVWSYSYWSASVLAGSPIGP